jgi:hypothetical protein
MNRRNVLLGILASGVFAGAGGALWLGSSSNNRPLTINASLQTLDRLMEEKPATLGDWDLYQILIHCAQSVEFSMSGFPEHKPPIFKNTIGSLAFSAFSQKGEMTHGLSEIIPGAPLIPTSEDSASAYIRFRESMVRFRSYSGTLAQHFAYGQLTKLEYERAHAMHFYNHLLEIELTS